MNRIEFYLPGEQDGLPLREWPSAPRVGELVSLSVDGSYRELKVTCVHWFDGSESCEGVFKVDVYKPVVAVTLDEVAA